MQHSAPAVPNRWTASTRGLRGDFGYVTCLALALLGIKALQVLIDDSLSFSFSHRLDVIGRILVQFTMVQLIPNVFVFTLALQIAPYKGLIRWLVMLSAVLLSVFWGNRFAVHAFGAHPSFDHVAEAFITVMFLGSGCFFRNTLRRAESELVKKRIETEALDAAFQRAQLELLHAQIEPHFLFNTLATVRTLAQTDRRSGADMIDSLLRYFEAAMPKLRQHETSLADEVNLIDAYLRIQKIRMGARLSYELSVPEGLLNARVPSVMLLTLVENAIKHGIGPAAGGGTIRISAECQRSMLTLRVVDTGQGMQAVLGHGSGLANVRARLTLLYRNRGTLSLDPGTPRGVVATIQIPSEVAA